jgi:hypothetical protein
MLKKHGMKGVAGSPAREPWTEDCPHASSGLDPVPPETGKAE